MGSFPLLESVNAIADASGRAVVTKGPERYGESWSVTLINTSTNSVLESKLRVYRNVESPTAQVLGTYSGNNDTASGGEAIRVNAGDKLVFVWSNCTVGASCSARLEGDYHSRRM